MFLLQSSLLLSTVSHVVQHVQSLQDFKQLKKKANCLAIALAVPPKTAAVNKGSFLILVLHWLRGAAHVILFAVPQPFLLSPAEHKLSKSVTYCRGQQI